MNRSILSQWVAFSSYFTLVASLSTNLFAADEVVERWPLRITPLGLPSVQFPLIRFTSKEFANSISVRHDLIFDGRRYRSRMSIPEFESYLITTGKNQFEWRTLTGDVVKLSLTVTSQPGNAPWTLMKTTDGGFHLQSHDGSEHFYYANCVLTSAILSARRYSFEYRDGHLIRITRVESGSIDELILLKYNADGALSSALVGTNTIIFHFVADLQLDAIDTDSPAAQPITLSYHDGLLTTITVGPDVQRFVWGEPIRNTYLKTPIPPAPCVLNDGRFAYILTSNLHSTAGSFHSLDGVLDGEWRLDIKTGKTRLQMHKRHPGETPNGKLGF